MIYANNKVFKNYRIEIPLTIRKACNVESDDVVEWILDDDGLLTLTFRKKIQFKQMRGAINIGKKTNAIKLERELYD